VSLTGVRADRPQLAKMMAVLKPGDIVTVTKLDRLGRSTRELLNLIDQISRGRAAFRSLGDPLWDTSNAQGRFERELIRERTEDRCELRRACIDVSRL
jgi:DNA invertase Pin-like site-specific DNA recombinase